MKDFYTFIITFTTILFGFISAEAQNSVSKKIFVEQFSNTKCPVCANRIPPFKAEMTPYAEHIEYISFFIAAPYPTCELYLANTTGSTARADSYGIPGSPTIHVNGTRVNQGNPIVSSSYYEERIGEQSSVEMNLFFDAQTGQTELTIKNHEVINGQNWAAFVFLVEKEVNAGTLNNYTVHHNVFRQNISPASGQPISFTQSEDEQRFDFNVNINTSWDRSKLKAVAVIQNTESKEVLNATNSDDFISSNKENNITSYLTVYPNPSQTGEFFVKNLYSFGKGEINILSSSGNIISTIATEKGFDQRLNLNHLPSGIYFLKYKDEKNTGIKKIIITR